MLGEIIIGLITSFQVAKQQQ